MNKNTENKTPLNWGAILRQASVPIMFIIICVICIPISGLSANMLINEIITRMGRNAFLILSLLIPIMAGMGLNFGMTLGAMAAEIGLILSPTGRSSESPEWSLQRSSPCRFQSFWVSSAEESSTVR